jgi:hypothetical protein
MEEPEEPFVLTFPMYSLLLKDGTGTVFLRSGHHTFLPLFTDSDNVLSYGVRTGHPDCIVHELPDAESVNRFVVNPPSRSPTPCEVTHIVIDPYDNQPRVLTVFTRASFLALLG